MPFLFVCILNKYFSIKRCGNHVGRGFGEGLVQVNKLQSLPSAGKIKLRAPTGCPFFLDTTAGCVGLTPWHKDEPLSDPGHCQC